MINLEVCKAIRHAIEAIDRYMRWGNDPTPNLTNTITVAIKSDWLYIDYKEKQIPIRKPLNSLDKFYAEYQRKFEKIFNSMWDRQQDMIKTSMVRDAMDNHSIGKLQELLDADTTAFTRNEFTPLYSECLQKAGVEQTKRIVKLVNSKMGFSMTSDRLVKLIKDKALQKVKELSTQQIASVRQVLQRGIAEGWGSVKTARFMKDVVPLNGQRTEWLFSYYDKLGDNPELSQAMIDYKTELYRKKLLKGRREMIARTEINRAYNEGNYESIRQAIDGEIIKGAKKVWRTVMDDRVRDEHMAMEGETVMLDEAFSNGSIYPDEVNCRCITEEILLI